jgi:hypothetical protein
VLRSKARLQFDAYRWHAGKLAPKKYGDRRCSRNVNVSFVVTSAAALDQDLRLEVHAALDVMLDVIAVLLRREPRDSEFAAVDAQPRNVRVALTPWMRRISGRWRDEFGLTKVRSTQAHSGL